MDKVGSAEVDLLEIKLARTDLDSLNVSKLETVGILTERH